MEDEKRLLMVTVSGPDQSGITAKLTGVLVKHGANDRLMLGQAGLSIAYNAKKGLERSAGASIGKSRMKNILHFLGITEEDITEALSCQSM